MFIFQHSTSPVQTYSSHVAAVKAIAWSPHQHGLLASGGGTADRCIRFWNTLTSQPMQCVDTGTFYFYIVILITLEIIVFCIEYYSICAYKCWQIYYVTTYKLYNCIMLL